MKKKIKFTVDKKFTDFKKRHKDHTEYVNLEYYILLEMLSMIHLDNYDFEYKTKFFPETPKWFTTDVPFSLIARYIITFPVSSNKREVYVFDRCGASDKWEIFLYIIEKRYKEFVASYQTAHDSGFETEFVIKYINILEKKSCAEVFKYQYQFILELIKEEEERLIYDVQSNIDRIENLKDKIEKKNTELDSIQKNRIEIEMFLKDFEKEVSQ